MQSVRFAPTLLPSRITFGDLVEQPMREFHMGCKACKKYRLGNRTICRHIWCVRRHRKTYGILGMEEGASVPMRLKHAGWKAIAPQLMQLSFVCLQCSAKQHHILSDLRCQYDVFLFLNRLHSVSIRKLRSDYSISDQPHHCA